jgi:dTDP-4-amino-4,6-dideoxygalactose transaminase
MIELVKPVKPNEKLLNQYLSQILETGFYTNNGPLAQLLERKLETLLGSNHALFTSNGTVSLEIALKAIKAKGNIVTTPYSYVATANAANWIGLEVRFADLKKGTFFPDPANIEALIDQNTSALLITQVYGMCGPIEEYRAIASKNNLPLILDAAHAFGVLYKGSPVSSYGDLASYSFHATKVFNTVEGGAITTNNSEMKERLFDLRAFGHRGDDYFSEGINGKNSEVHAAFGLAQIDDVNVNLERRKKVFENYMTGLNFKDFSPIFINKDLSWNYCYFPLVFQDCQYQEKLREHLLKNEIMSRRYFFPALNTLPQFEKSSCPLAEDLANKVLCIPLHASLELEKQQYIIDVMNEFSQKG